MQTTDLENNDQQTQGVNRLVRTQRAVVDGTKQAAQATDDYVHGQPWIAVGIAAGLGGLLGFLLPRR